jgi:hypothetical protein
MNLKGFQALLDRPSWSKDVVVWVGSGEVLGSALEKARQVELDLLDLFPEDEALPASRDDRADLLRGQLDAKLQQVRPTDAERIVLRVRNAALLARYGVGLRSFYDWFGGARTLAVLEINRTRPVQLPSAVTANITFDTDALVEYFRPLLAKPDNLCVEVE